eukprot:6694037-Prymnesium_polylepis.1
MTHASPRAMRLRENIPYATSTPGRPHPTGPRAASPQNSTWVASATIARHPPGGARYGGGPGCSWLKWQI